RSARYACNERTRKVAINKYLINPCQRSASQAQLTTTAVPNTETVLADAAPWLAQDGRISFRKLHQVADEVSGRIRTTDTIADTATVETLAIVPTAHAVMYDDDDLVR